MKRFADVRSKVDHSRSQILAQQGSSFKAKSKSNAVNQHASMIEIADGAGAAQEKSTMLLND